jgi:hypothetical protein
VKVGSDRTNASYVPDGVTSAELREELFSTDVFQIAGSPFEA